MDCHLKMVKFQIGLFYIKGILSGGMYIVAFAEVGVYLCACSASIILKDPGIFLAPQNLSFRVNWSYMHLFHGFVLHHSVAKHVFHKI